MKATSGIIFSFHSKWNFSETITVKSSLQLFVSASAFKVLSAVYCEPLNTIQCIIVSVLQTNFL